MGNNCQSTQENIAVGHNLTIQNQAHLDQCAKCLRVFEEYKRLKRLFTLNSNGIAIPDGFVDAVMARIDQESTPALNDWFAKSQGQLSNVMSRPLCQWVLLCFGFLMSLSNLTRFVLLVLTPAS